jgi:hypothetical protein
MIPRFIVCVTDNVKLRSWLQRAHWCGNMAQTCHSHCSFSFSVYENAKTSGHERYIPYPNPFTIYAHFHFVELTTPTFSSSSLPFFPSSLATFLQSLFLPLLPHVLFSASHILTVFVTAFLKRDWHPLRAMAPFKGDLDSLHRAPGSLGLPPPWSSGQSVWLLVQRSGFDSWRYQIFWEVVGLERGPISLVSTTEDLLGRKSSGSGLEIREYGRRDPSRWPRSTLYPQKLALTSPTSGGRSVGVVRSRT